MKKIALPLLCLVLLAAAGGSEPHATAKNKRKPHFTVGKETTYITEPLDADGYIDYAAALNERLRRGVTPENNANVLLWKAFGPHPEGAKMPAEFFKWMGVTSPPERGDYFIPLSRYVKEHLRVNPLKEGNAIYDELQHCAQRSWTAKQHPNIAEWLKTNEKPLALVLEASRRSHYFDPLMSKKTDKGSSAYIGSVRPGLQPCRGLSKALTVRAMLRVGERRFDDAWQDLLACHRLGRLVARGGTLIEALVGIDIDYVTSKADLAFLGKAELKAEQIKNCLRDLQKLPPMPLIADKVDLGERFLFLNVLMMVQRGGLEALSGFVPDEERNLLTKLSMTALDWDPVLRNLNRWYDCIAKAMRIKDRDAREKQLDRIDKELRKLNEKIGNIMIGLTISLFRKVQNAADRIEQLQRNLYLAFALAAYRREFGRYPKELDVLTPKYLAKIPQDIFSGAALIYRPSENGYLLYSVGVNGKDEQGHGYDDGPGGDDLPVRMPLPQLPQK